MGFAYSVQQLQIIYLATWEEAVRSNISSTGLIARADEGALSQRAIHGMNQYVALYNRDDRYLLSIATVLSADSGFKDVFTVT